MKGLKLLILGLFALFSVPILAATSITYNERETHVSVCHDIASPVVVDVSVQPKIIYRKPCTAKIDSADIAKEKEYFRTLQTLARSRVKVRCGTSATSPSYIR